MLVLIPIVLWARRQAERDMESFEAFLKWEKKMQINFQVDWSVTCTLSAFYGEFDEEHLGVTELKGVGWYSKNGDTMLVQATDDPEQFLFMVWYGRDPRQAMLAACMSLPDHTYQP
jgi:hypothetical protein